MALSIQLASNFDASAVCFSKLRKNKKGGKAVYINNGNKKAYVQLPYMRAPFGLSSFTDENSGNTSYSLDLSFDDSLTDLEQTLSQLDERIIQTVAENSEEWLGKKYNVAVIREALYKPLVRPGKGKDGTNYPSTIKLKVLTDMRTDKFIPEAYNSEKIPVELDTIDKGQRVMTIVDFNQIWFIDNKFGVSVRLQQALLEPSKKLPSFAFQGVSPEENSDEDEIDEE